MTADPLPIDGGYCIKRIDDDHCVDVMRMAYNWRLVVTARPNHEFDHGNCVITAGWCYFGHGEDPDTGKPRSMYGAYLAASAAAQVFDGTGEPPGYHKRAL